MKKFKFIYSLITLLLLSACTSQSDTKSMNTSSAISSSQGSKFKLKEDTAKQKNDINNIIKLYNQYGLVIDIQSFNDGYSVNLKNTSLLQDIRDNDKNGFLKNTIIPVTQKISAQTNTKIYFNANDPNLELIVIVNKGIIEYQINLSK
ncbi:hypothetical protein ACWCL1_07480 [Ligilactobacillus sp. LYQ135]